MQVTVNIPDELANQVRARGESPEMFVNRLLEEASRTANDASNRNGTSDLDPFFKAMAAKSEKIPQLPDEAFARDSFYGMRTDASFAGLPGRHQHPLAAHPAIGPELRNHSKQP
jgi:hypothetical protein